jgi:60 kDa SS-A/Ro ribonucleoprotein
MQYVDGLRGWGRGLRNAAASWYSAKAPEDLVYQSIKYRHRNGWTHCDALRLAHPK